MNMSLIPMYIHDTDRVYITIGTEHHSIPVAPLLMNGGQFVDFADFANLFP
jgi:hypothetical protein